MEYTAQPFKVCPYYLILEGVLHLQLFSDLELGPILSRPLIQEVSQIIAYVVEVGELEVKDVLIVRGDEQVSNVAIIVAQHPRSLPEYLK